MKSPAAHLVFDVALAGRLLMGLAAFSGVAGASYVFNDVRDADDDRLHVTKRKRPLASGKMSTRAALVAAAVLATLSLVLAISTMKGCSQIRNTNEAKGLLQGRANVLLSSRDCVGSSSPCLAARRPKPVPSSHWLVDAFNTEGDTWNSGK